MIFLKVAIITVLMQRNRPNPTKKKHTGFELLICHRLSNKH
jgi:hypothetical protein